MRYYNISTKFIDLLVFLFHTRIKGLDGIVATYKLSILDSKRLLIIYLLCLIIYQMYHVLMSTKNMLLHLKQNCRNSNELPA